MQAGFFDQNRRPINIDLLLRQREERREEMRDINRVFVTNDMTKVVEFGKVCDEERKRTICKG